MTPSLNFDLTQPGDVRLMTPGQPGWQYARLPWNRAVSQSPVLSATPRSAAEVAQVVRAAARKSLRVAAQCTGHEAATVGSLERSILIRTSYLRQVAIDPVARRARLGAGATWTDVAVAAAPHGLAPLAASLPDVGVVGAVLGGAFGWLSRTHGLAAHRLLGAEVVTADGQIRTVGPDREPDLLWALRGGGGGCAVVTAIEIELIPLPELHAGMLVWPLADAGRVLPEWVDWTAEAPRAANSTARLLRLPPDPQLAPGLQGRDVLAIELAVADVPAHSAELLAPLRALGPTLDTVCRSGPLALGDLAMAPSAPVPVLSDGTLLGALPTTSIADVIDLAGARAESSMFAVELRHLGGALRDAHPGIGAAGRVGAEFAMVASGIVGDAGAHRRVADQITALKGRLGRIAAPRGCMAVSGRPEPSEQLFAPAILDRLRAVKAAYDPGDVIQASHPIRGAQR